MSKGKGKPKPVRPLPVRCPDCQGAGYFIWSYIDGLDHYHSRYYECQTCGGIGMIDVVKKPTGAGK